MLSQTSLKVLRIGIYAGTFNPVHVGHITFALQAIQAAQLDMIYFLPERRPRHKRGVEHYAHRVAMLKAAVKPHPQLGVLDMDDVSFTVQRTLPHLESLFAGAQLVFLVGSDVALHLQAWPRSERLLVSSELVIGIRYGQKTQQLRELVETWNQQPKAVRIIESYAPHVSSYAVREALQARRVTAGLLQSVARYSNKHWLYVSLANPST